MSECVEVAQPKLARQVWSLDRAYRRLSAQPPTSLTSDPHTRPVRMKPEHPMSSVASVSRSVASSLRRVEFALHPTPKSALSGAFLQLRRTARRSKLQRSTERFVSLNSILGRVSGSGW